MKVRCKRYHQPTSGNRPRRLSRHAKSRCPPWAADDLLQQRLITEAIPDPRAAEDVFGRPKRLWNAVAGTVFVGVSTSEQEPAYNCYPEVPLSELRSLLSQRAERTIEQFMRAEEA